MIKTAIRTIFATALFASSAFPQGKNVILFIGDWAGVSSLNAASIFGYGEPRSLYVQNMPHLTMADTSTAKEWVTDGAACASAWATGKKTRNGVVSMSADAVVSAFYAHHNNRGRSGEIFLQFLNSKFGHGPDIAIGTGRKVVNAALEKAGYHVADEAKAKGYTFLGNAARLRCERVRHCEVVGVAHLLGTEAGGGSVGGFAERKVRRSSRLAGRFPTSTSSRWRWAPVTAPTMRCKSSRRSAIPADFIC